MKLENMQRISLLMTLLVLTIPILSANAFASVTTYSISNNGARDYRAADDKSTVFAEISDLGVTASDVTLVAQKSIPFKSCSASNGKSICTYEFTSGQWAPGVWPYSVSYKGQTAANSITVDTLSPNVTINSLDSSSQIRVDYSVKDRAFNSNDASKCSGIGKIDFTLAGSVIKTVDITPVPGSCQYNSVSNMSAPSTNGISKTFCVEAYDAVGNLGSSCQDIIVDRESSQASDVQILSQQGNPLTFISPRTGPISAKLKFTLNEYNLASLTADASDFSTFPQQKQSMKNIAATCAPVSCGGSCSCEVPITLNLPQGGSPVLRIHSVDKSGNSGDSELPVSVSLDTDAPQITSLVAKQCGDKNAIGPSGNTVTATIDETGSGLGARKVYLDLSSALGPQYGKVFATDCSQAGNNWICKWEDFNVPVNHPQGSRLPINIVSPSQDDAGNYISAPPSNFFYDNTPPSINSTELFASSALSFGEEITAYPTSGGTIEIRIHAKDDLPLTATADFSHAARIGKVSTDCTQDGSTQTCLFTQIGPLFNGPLNNVPISVNVSDCVGNTVKKTVKINISSVSSQNNNYWDYSVTGRSPDKVDRQTLQVFPYRVYFPIDLYGSDQVSPIVQQIVNCDGDKGYLAYNIKNQRLPDVINSPSTHPYAIFNIQRATSPPDKLSYTCTFKTISRTSNGAISLPEFDNVTFEIPFYDSPLGTIDQATQQKINAVKNSSLVKGKIIGTLQKYLDIGTNLCNIWGTIAGIASSLAGIEAGLSWLDVTPAAPVLKVISGLSHSLSFVSTNVVGKYVGYTCDMISCKSFLLFGNDNIAEKVRKVMQDLFEKWQGSALTKYNLGRAFGANTTINPKDSLIYSVGTLCLPGIVSNLQKARQIECEYVVCMQSNVPQGIPPFFCGALKAQQWCKYVWGQIFQVIPFTQFIQQAIDTVKKAITDPIGVAASYITDVCILKIKVASLHSACLLVKNVPILVGITQKLFAADTWKNVGHSGPDVCNEIK